MIALLLMMATLATAQRAASAEPTVALSKFTESATTRTEKVLAMTSVATAMVFIVHSNLSASMGSRRAACRAG